ncbi:hypothetical protein GPECTOR_10g1087 [Gonium pectorale]|uniref:Pherophorin domain-containing protein n=1 Tax=Gonium pectorale TaxID=33097 RepID=A0A150GQJ7_GONPE|nr:hypothetical protein GPECTOR_10g1087 [Gonium pectorale]|eukprot:KXZ52064.1 hypothetical protein GPECTOR_10g1087 [Gonium pectorale]
MVVRTKSDAKVVAVTLDGQAKDFDVGAQGLTIYRMRVDPSNMRSMQLEIRTDTDGYNYGFKRTGSDTAYLFQLVAKKIITSPDLDGDEPGDCSEMTLRDFGVAIYDDLIVKSVQFNGTVMDAWDEQQGVKPDAKWVYINVLKTINDFSDGEAVDFVITVRGKVDSLCPANEYLHSPNACEFTLHGKGSDQHCCPHGATKRGGPPDECCVDDVEKAPYRVQYIDTSLTDVKSEYEFAVAVVNVTGTDFDMEEPADCDHMTLDYAQIQIYKNVKVLEVRWEDRRMDFNLTFATDYSNWLNINGINRFINDFDPNLPTYFKIVVDGYVRELCPAGHILGAGGAFICEYVLHGVQGNHTCCPHDITRPGSRPADCGCRDDLAGTPYRLGYQLGGVVRNETIFNFDLAKIDPSAALDFDGAPDKQFGLDVNCADMAIKYVSFVVNADLEVKDISFNGFNYTWQFEPYTSRTKWLKVLDLDYRPSDFPADKPVHLQVLVKGNTTTELCPAASQFSSQASCEYVLYGLSSEKLECCPVGLTTWTSQFRTAGR